MDYTKVLGFEDLSEESWDDLRDIIYQLYDHTYSKLGYSKRTSILMAEEGITLAIQQVTTDSIYSTEYVYDTSRVLAFQAFKNILEEIPSRYFKDHDNDLYSDVKRIAFSVIALKPLKATDVYYDKLFYNYIEFHQAILEEMIQKGIIERS